MRTNNSIKNGFVAIIASFISILIGFVAQKIFISILSTEYLGINGLFTNILSMLSIAELGVGEAIIFHLYKPIANDNKEEIKSLLRLYQKSYNVIAIIVLIVGLILIPFLGFFIGKTTLNLNFVLVYILFLLQTVASYILTYKRSILFAYQKNYVVNIIHCFYLFLLNIFQLLILYLTKNYYIYLAIKVVFILFENLVINAFANKMYPFINDKNVKKLEKNVERDIFVRVKAQFLHKIGFIAINATDNIIISKFIGVAVVGLYSNYYLIINSVRNLFGQLIASITASVGDLLVDKNKDKSFEVYKKIRFFNFWISTFAATSILVIIQSFILVWLGNDYLLPQMVVYILVFNFYQKMMRSCNEVFLSAAGICVENRFVPLIESVVNIVSSIILLKFFGLAGVFIGTVVSGLVLWCYSYPKFVYKNLFKRSYLSYAKETISYIIIFLLIAIITYFVSTLFIVENLFLQLIINILICVSIPNIILLIIFWKNDNMLYFKDLMFKTFDKILIKIKRA